VKHITNYAYTERHNVSTSMNRTVTNANKIMFDSYVKSIQNKIQTTKSPVFSFH